MKTLEVDMNLRILFEGKEYDLPKKQNITMDQYLIKKSLKQFIQRVISLIPKRVPWSISWW